MTYMRKGVEPRKCYLRELVFILSRFRRGNIMKWERFFQKWKLDFHILRDSCICSLDVFDY